MAIKRFYSHKGAPSRRKSGKYTLHYSRHSLDSFASQSIGDGPQMKSSARPLGTIGRVCRLFYWLSLGYWSLYVLVAPVTNIDSQVYDIARLDLAMKGGLFDNSYFTSAYQLMWPWTFDAVHLPFLELGWGFALPSFSCLIGTCVVVFLMTRDKFCPDAAWMAVMSLMGLTCLVYQGTSTKNDIPLVFCGAVWTYARWRWQKERNGVHIFWMVLATAFMAGTKTTGVIYGGILALWTLWETRSNGAQALRTLLALAAATLLFGSFETYVESARVYGNPLGPARIIERLRNPDGVRGAIANLSRYVVGSVYVGPSHFRSGPPAILKLVSIEQTVLSTANITDAGLDQYVRMNKLFFVQSGFEELSGFGPVGSFAMATIVLACFCWRKREIWWQLSVVAFIGFAIVSYNVAYSDWANRYLISWYAIGTVAFVCLLWNRESSFRSAIRWCFALVAIASACAAPLLSFDRGPSSIAACLIDRDKFETCMYPLIGKVRRELRNLRVSNPNSRIYFIVLEDSAVLPILEDHKLDAVLVTPAEFGILLAKGNIANGDIVIEDYPVKTHALKEIMEVSAPDVLTEDGIRTQRIYTVEN
jgi:hypothetical protein